MLQMYMISLANPSTKYPKVGIAIDFIIYSILYKNGIA